MLQCCSCGCRGGSTEFLRVKGFFKCTRCYGQAVRVGNFVGANVASVDPTVRYARGVLATPLAPTEPMSTQTASPPVATPPAESAPAESAPASAPSSSDKGLSAGAKAAIVVGAFAAVAALYAVASSKA